MVIPATTQKLTKSSSPANAFFAEYEDGAVTREGYGIMHTFRKLVCAETQEELAAEVARLNLTPCPKTKRQQARELFLSFPPEVRTRFMPLLQALEVISVDADVAAAIAAVTVPAEVEVYKAQLLAVLR